MNLYWCKTVPPNVGDALNTWLWPKLIPELDTLDQHGTLFGIGSILDERLNSPGPKYILGSGARRRNPGIDVKTDLRVFAVRGPLTAAALELEPSLAIIDPASMIARHYRTPASAHREVGIVPYFSSPHGPWNIIAERLGYRLISPHLGVDEFLFELSQCKFVITEAMHGAILADGLRIPWRPIRANCLALEGPTSTYKWTDWCQSVDVPFVPVDLPALWDMPKNIIGSTRTGIKMRWIERKLQSIVSGKTRCLSQAAVLNDRLDHFEDTIGEFRRASSSLDEKFGG